MNNFKYSRVLLKLSGESLMGSQSYGIDPNRLNVYARQIAKLAKEGLQIGIVIGGGNIFRGISGAAQGIDRIQGDYMGMLATVINSMALQAELKKEGAKACVLSGIEINPLCEKMSSSRAISLLEEGNIVIMAAGTGNPFFTTDTGSALRAIEIKADLLLKGTRVDGVYSADPEKDPTATKYSSLSFEEAYQKQLRIMDLTAFTLCKENSMPIYVFDMDTEGNLEKLVKGEHIGSIIK